MTHEIDLETLKDILGISYPTALAMAREVGRKIDEPPRGRWVIEASIIRAIIEREIAEAMDKQDRLAAACNGA